MEFKDACFIMISKFIREKLKFGCFKYAKAPQTVNNTPVMKILKDYYL